MSEPARAMKCSPEFDKVAADDTPTLAENLGRCVQIERAHVIAVLALDLASGDLAAPDGPFIDIHQDASIQTI